METQAELLGQLCSQPEETEASSPARAMGTTKGRRRKPAVPGDPSRLSAPCYKASQPQGPPRCSGYCWPQSPQCRPGTERGLCLGKRQRLSGGKAAREGSGGCGRTRELPIPLAPCKRGRRGRPSRGRKEGSRGPVVPPRRGVVLQSTLRTPEPPEQDLFMLRHGSCPEHSSGLKREQAVGWQLLLRLGNLQPRSYAAQTPSFPCPGISQPAGERTGQ